MKSFFQSLNKKEIKSSIKNITHRFPLAVTISIAVSTLFFILIATSLSNEVSQIIGKYILTGIVVFFLSLSTTLFCESVNYSQKDSFLYQIWVWVFWVLFYYYIPEDFGSFESVIFFILTLIGIISSLFIAPYLQYWKKQNYIELSYYIYFYRVSVVFFLTFIVWWSLALLWNIAILTITTLFDIRYSIWWDIHAYWTVLSLCFLTPCFTLSQIPKKWTFEEQKFDENAFFHFLIRYIAIPFIYVYFIILYAYSCKVLLNFTQWPKWEVSWMVIGFSTFWYMIYIFSYIFQEWKKSQSNKLIRLFRKYFPIVVIPQIWMLFYAIALRIGQYDFTINRYFVVVFGIWLLLSSLYFIISHKKSVFFLPALLTIFTIIISIGPWSVYSFPLERQTQRLENNLRQAGILVDMIDSRKIIPLENYTDIDPKLSGEIYNWINYLCDFNNCDAIKNIFPEIYKELLIKDSWEFESKTGQYSYISNEDTRLYPQPSTWQIQSYISKKIKVQYYNPGISDRPVVYSLYAQDWIFPLDIAWYDFAFEVNRYQTGSWAYINGIRQEITIQVLDISDTLSIENIFQSLRENYQKNSDSTIKKWENIFELESDIFSAVLIVENASIFADSNSIANENQSQQSIWWILLVKQK